MAKLMNINVLGLVENMSYVVCPDCGKKFNIFGNSSADIAADTGLELLAQMPIDPSLAVLTDSGSIEKFEGDFLAKAVEKIESV